MRVVRIASSSVSAEIWTLGAAVNALEAPDRDGNRASVVLGHADEAARRVGEAYLGEIVGPYGNRIAGASFEVTGRSCRLPVNWLGRHTLHSGPDAFHRQDWAVLDSSPAHVTLGLTWTDREADHPGPVHTTVTYQVDEATFSVVVDAWAEADTYLNVVWHPYVNLAGTATVADHELSVAADAYLPVDDDLIPLPESPAEVHDRFDLRRGRRLGDVIATGGLDHCYVLGGAGLREVAVLADPESGRQLRISTDQPGLQVYTGGGLDESVVGPAGPYRPFAGVALETQHFPDGPHRPDYPPTFVSAGDHRVSRTLWSLTADG